MRMTEKDTRGNWTLKGVTWKELAPGQVITKEGYVRLYGALHKLLDYEEKEQREREARDTLLPDGASEANAERLEELQNWMEEGRMLLARLIGLSGFEKGPTGQASE